MIWDPMSTGLNKRESELAELSSRGRLIVATKSDHQIYLYEPELVTSAIRDVVGQAKSLTPVAR